jgi:DUF4097 and DUF4098 domain-containing protein YvlB
LKQLSKFVVVLLLALPLASAQQSRVYGDGGNWTREITGSLSAVKNLKVKVDIGSVRVEGGSQQGISYVIHSHSYSRSEDKARRELESYKVTAYVRGDTAWIVGDFEDDKPRKFSGEFVINVPREMDEVKIETDGGSITTTGIAGEVDAQSGGGFIHLDDIGGKVNAETGGGGIEVGSIASDASLHTGGGSIRVNSTKGNLEAESGGGDVTVVSAGQSAVLQTGGGSIRLEHCDGEVKASTGGGSIDLGDVGGKAEMETGGGSIRLASSKGAVHAETGGGGIELNGVPSARAETGAGGIVARFIASNGERTDSLLETSAGDITVYLAPNININVRASIEVANGHSIRSDFPDVRVTTEGGDYGPKTVSAEGSLNGGGPVLKVRTTTGDIDIRRSSH